MEFQTIFKEYSPKIYRYLVRLVGQAEAEDLTQEVFIKANRGLADFRATAKVSTWLYRIATNAAVDLIRKRGGAPVLISPLGEEMDEAWVPELSEAKAGGCLQHGIEHQEMNACIRALMAGLPEHYRTILLLSEVEGFTNKEIGEILGVSLATVKMRIHRGKERLRATLNRHCVISLDGRNEFVCDPKRGSN
jgi:RNA polymerase sigma-70 factor (ECF subfamily)